VTNAVVVSKFVERVVVLDVVVAREVAVACEVSVKNAVILLVSKAVILLVA
jgi:hypothetical protein